MDQPGMPNNEILSIQFNQKGDHFICGTNQGIRLYFIRTNFDLIEDYNVGRIKICGMVGSSNIVYFVSADNNQQFPDNYVQFFDMEEEAVSARLMCPTTVTAVRMKPDKVVVSSKNRLSIFSFPDLARLIEIEAANNPEGLLDLSPLHCYDDGYIEFVIYPGHTEGSMEILDTTKLKPELCPAPVTLQCHDNKLACLALNKEGTKAATASVGNNTIRIWDTIAKRKLLEVKSGSDDSICSLAFNEKSDYLCCTNEKGWMYVFKVEMHGVLDSLKNIFGGGPSVSKKTSTECRNVCAFGDIPNTVHIVTFDGLLDSIRYDIKTKGAYERHVKGDLWNIEKKQQERSPIRNMILPLLLDSP